jgi:hypothetical protein
MPSSESRRIHQQKAALDNDDEEGDKDVFRSTLGGESSGAKWGTKRGHEEVEEYDHEVYDDRMFYAMLLKVRGRERER